MERIKELASLDADALEERYPEMKRLLDSITLAENVSVVFDPFIVR